MEEKHKELLKKIKCRISEKRFRHSLRTAIHAKELATIFGVDQEKAFIAGLLHDIARDLNAAKLNKLAEQYKIKISKIVRDNPVLLHGPVGAKITENEFGVKDKDILEAIENHTFGKEKMSNLEKIIFVADFTEVERKFPEAQFIRDLLDQKNLLTNKNKIKILDKAVVKKAESMIKYARKNNWQILKSLLKLTSH